VSPADTRTVPRLFQDAVARFGDRVAFRYLAAGGAPADQAFTWSDWHESARAFAAALIDAGHEPGDVVAIWADNRPAWPIADVGASLAGVVVVGLYPTSAPVQVRHLLQDAGARTVVVDTPHRLATVSALAVELPRMERILAAHEARADGAGEPADSGGTASPGRAGVARGTATDWSNWLERGRRALADPALVAELERRAAAVQPEDVAALIYTSGSTGAPKGARIPHRYLLASAASIRDTLGLTAADTSLSFLPFCHAGERVFGLYTRILCGIECGLVADPARVWDAARAYRPTFFGGLPRFYEKVFETLESERQSSSGPERERWDQALELGRHRSRELRAGRALSSDREAEWDRLVAPFRDRLRDQFGGRLRLATSGGAVLPEGVAEYLDALGVTVLGAYGLTEHLCVVFNRPGRYTFDTAGPPMPGTTLRIDRDGEILVRRSELTFAGYRRRAEATAEAFTPDGLWLRTGDLGEVDARGFLRITGRKKELIALSTGKKVAPVPIEVRLTQHPWIAHAVLYGESRKFVTALLSLRRPVVEAWARGAGLDASFHELVARPELLDRVRMAVDEVNGGLSRSEQVKRFVLLDRELSLDQDELTPTLKVRRGFVTARFRDQLEALYR
jgi:long-chain acyl-CoA synthetase